MISAAQHRSALDHLYTALSAAKAGTGSSSDVAEARAAIHTAHAKVVNDHTQLLLWRARSSKGFVPILSPAALSKQKQYEAAHTNEAEQLNAAAEKIQAATKPEQLKPLEAAKKRLAAAEAEAADKKQQVSFALAFEPGKLPQARSAFDEAMQEVNAARKAVKDLSA